MVFFRLDPFREEATEDVGEPECAERVPKHTLSRQSPIKEPRVRWVTEPRVDTGGHERVRRFTRGRRRDNVTERRRCVDHGEGTKGLGGDEEGEGDDEPPAGGDDRKGG